MDFDLLQYLAANWFNIGVTVSAAASATIAYLSFKESRRGPEIELLTKGPFELKAWTQDITNPFRRNMYFRGILVFQNKGPRGGTVLDMKASVKEPVWKYETVRDGATSWEFAESSVQFESEPFQHFDPTSMALALREHDTGSLRISVSFVLRDSEWDKRPPQRTFDELLKTQGRVVVQLEYKVSTAKGKLDIKSAELQMYPKI